MNTAEAKRVLETALICAHGPLPLQDMRALFDAELGLDTLRRLLGELVDDWRERGVELVCVASGWRFQSRPEMRVFLDRLHPEKPPKYSRAAMETLAIVAYRQPVTRGDIEDIRGVTVSTQIVKQLEDRGWIDAIGYREAPGRPALYATTKQFLDDLGLASLDQLPSIDSQADAERAMQAISAMEALPFEVEGGQGSLALEGESQPQPQLDVHLQVEPDPELPPEMAMPPAQPPEPLIEVVSEAPVLPAVTAAQAITPPIEDAYASGSPPAMDPSA